MSESAGVSRADAFQAGRVVLGRYELREPLGEGTFGEVWLGWDRLAQVEVAVKVLHHGQDEAAVRREHAALRGLSLPGVVALLDAGQEGGRAILVLERVSGRPFPGETGRVDWGRLAPRLRALLLRLGAIHARGILHLDLKPENVRVTAEGEVVLLDLGLASGPGVSIPDPWRATGGSERYASPEQLLGREVSPPSDLYAAGVMVYEALTGRLPQDSAQDVRAGRIRREPVPLGTLREDLPAAVCTVVTSMVSRRAADRPRTAWEVLERLGLGQEELSLAEGHGTILDDPRSLFVGPSLLLHIPEDAAWELMRRTDGQVALVREEIRSWTRAGLARVANGRVELSRAELNRISSGEGADFDGSLRRFGPDAERVLACLVRAFPMGRLGVLRAALCWPDERLDRALEELRSGHALVELASGLLRPTARCALELDDVTRTALIHALPLDCQPRARLSAASGDPTGRAAEAMRVARKRWGAGEADAEGAARIPLALARLAQAPVIEADALALLATLALASGAPDRLADALYEHERGTNAGRLPSEALLRAAMAALGSAPHQGFQAALATDPGADRALQERRLGVLNVAAARSNDPELSAIADREARRWAEHHDDDEARARVEVLAGRQAYRAEEYAAASLRFEAALARPTAMTVRLGALVGAATSALELGRLGFVVSLADQVVRLAADRRLHVYEARGRWLEREAGYRARAPLRPSAELIEAARALGDPATLGTIAFCEARLAAADGSPERAATWANEAGASFSSAHMSGGAMLCEAFVAARSGRDTTDKLRAILGNLRGDHAWQAAGELLLACRRPDPALVAELTVHLRGLPRRGVQRELFSPSDLLDRLAGANFRSQR